MAGASAADMSFLVIVIKITRSIVIAGVILIRILEDYSSIVSAVMLI